MTKGQGEKNYDQNLAQVFTFHDLNKFALYWNCCKYDDSANLIYSTVDETEKKVKRDDKEYFIDGLNLFREGIKPLWESEHNSNGYHFQCELEVTPHTLDLLSKIYEELWASFVFGLIGEECEYSNCINGMRYLYKANKTSVRVE